MPNIADNQSIVLTSLAAFKLKNQFLKNLIHLDNDQLLSSFEQSYMCPLSAEFGYAFSTKTRPMETTRPPRLMKELQVLVVDNDPDCRHLLTVLFAAYGVRTIATGLVCEAIAILQDIKPDLLISELALPGEDGYSLMQQVKALENRHQAHIPAIALTGHNQKGDRAHALAVGFCKYLAKPVDLDELIATVAELTESSQMVPTT